MTLVSKYLVESQGRPRGEHVARVAVSIVAWKGANLTIDCLRSIEPEVSVLQDCHVYVVDNASPDDSADQVERAIAEHGWGDWVTFIRSPRNGGFAAGNNAAIRAMHTAGQLPQYVLFLNPDTVVRPGAFRILLEFMQQHPQWGIAGGRSEDPDSTPQFCCFRFPNAISEMSLYLRTGLFDRVFGPFLTRMGVPEQTCEVDWVSGAFMMVRREVLEDIGLMDEGYFLYYEETDFILRARRAGWSCWHVPQSRIVHLIGQSSGVVLRANVQPRRPAYWFESRRRYFVLNHGRLYAMIADVSAIAGFAGWHIRRFLLGRSDNQPPGFFTDFLKHSAILNGRATLKPREIDL